MGGLGETDLVIERSAPGPNTYAAPWFELAPTSAPKAPTTAVSPETPTEVPKMSFAAPSEAVSLAICVASVQPVAGLTNTYSAPWSTWPPTVAKGAPATTVSPATATARASWSNAAPS